LRSQHRTLSPLEVEPYADVTLSLAELADPEQAVGLDKLMAMFSFGAEFHHAPRPVRQALPFVALVAGAYLLWRFTPLHKVLRLRRRRSTVANVLRRLGFD
jgi:hypothetical protein